MGDFIHARWFHCMAIQCKCTDIYYDCKDNLCSVSFANRQLSSPYLLTSATRWSGCGSKLIVTISVCTIVRVVRPYSASQTPSSSCSLRERAHVPSRDMCLREFVHRFCTKTPILFDVTSILFDVTPILFDVSIGARAFAGAKWSILPQMVSMWDKQQSRDLHFFQAAFVLSTIITQNEQTEHKYSAVHLTRRAIFFWQDRWGTEEKHWGESRKSRTSSRAESFVLATFGLRFGSFFPIVVLLLFRCWWKTTVMLMSWRWKQAGDWAVPSYCRWCDHTDLAAFAVMRLLCMRT